MEGGGYVIGVFAPQYKDEHPYLSRDAVVLAYSPNATLKLSYNALQRTHRIRPQFRSLNTRSLSWISEPFADFAAAQRACNAINDALTEVEKNMKIAEVSKWYVGGKEQDIYWAQCKDCTHWRKTAELVSEEVEWHCPGSCPSEDDAE